MDVGAVDVRDEVGAQSGVTERGERLGDHRRAEIAAADPDVDDVGDAVVGSDPIGERRHRVEHLVDVGHDVLAVGFDRGSRPAHAAPCAAPPGPRSR